MDASNCAESGCSSTCPLAARFVCRLLRPAGEGQAAVGAERLDGERTGDADGVLSS